MTTTTTALALTGAPTTTADALAPAERADLRADPRAFEPSSIHEALQIAQTLVASRFLPRSVATPEAAFAIIATGRELGLSAMQSLRSIHIVEGKPVLSADLMVALVKRSPACAWFRLVESSAEVARYETQRQGEPSPTSIAFTMREAVAAGVAGKDNWRKYPSAMLRARCASALARAVYPDVVGGIYDPDELGADVRPEPQQRPEPRDVTPARVVVEPAPQPVAAPVVEPAATPDPDAPGDAQEPEESASDRAERDLRTALEACASPADLAAWRKRAIPLRDSVLDPEAYKRLQTTYATVSGRVR